MKTTTLISSLLILAISAGFMGCKNDDNEPESTLPPVSLLKIVGNRMDEDFRSTGDLELGAVPQAPDSTAILSDQLQVDLEILQPANVNSEVAFDEIVEPSNLPIAALLHLDQSSSMLGSDPSRLRVRGAKAFVDVMAGSGRSFDCAVAAFGSLNYADGFYDSDLLSGFTGDVSTLHAALDRVAAGTSTPTYESLLEMLPFLNNTKPATAWERVIVLLSDGQPNSNALRNAVCELADSLNIRVYTIGLGPASDIAGNSPSAVAEMRSLADCTNGLYAGISDANDSSAVAIYNAIATATAKGYIRYRVHISGAGFDQLAHNAVIHGRFTISSSAGSAAADVEVRVP